jgi:hypothetical protein
MKLTMQTDATRAAHRGSYGRRADGERGYIMVTFALLLVPIMLMAGLSIDVGSWYNRASNIQKAADAAALAGVVWLPDLDDATTYALASAAKNGFVPGGSITITVSQVGDRRLKVVIRDSTVKSFFTNKFGGRNIALQREAIAEYVLPVPLGSPRNFFGLGSLPTGYNENIFQAVNTWCTDKIDGDRFQSPFTGNRPYSNQDCQTTYSGSKMNSEYRNYGYETYVEVPASRTGNIDVLLFDPQYIVSGSGIFDLLLYTGSQSYNYKLYEADNTPLTDNDNPLVAGCSVNINGATAWDAITFLGSTRWNKLCTITTAMPTGKYILRVTNSVGSRYAAGSNSYGVVAKYASAAYTNTAALCDARVTTTCPRVYGKDAISVYANQSSSTADFYLAEIDSIHIGKKMAIELFDPGEGGNDIRIRRPTGSSTWTDATFTWKSSDGATGGPTTTLDVTNSQFNGETVELLIDLAGYSPPTDNKWWQIRYNFGGNTVTDRTTWSAKVIGDPVHLIEPDA